MLGKRGSLDILRDLCEGNFVLFTDATCHRPHPSPKSPAKLQLNLLVYPADEN
tara:strand:+ start:2949 stop:3107 length:159 start_codon:yes stop_codon:yes gene_type:complete